MPDGATLDSGIHQSDAGMASVRVDDANRPRVTHRRLMRTIKALILPAAALILGGTLFAGSRSAFSAPTVNAGNNWAASASFSTDVDLAGGWTTGLTHTVGTGSDRLLVFVAGMENNFGDRDLTAVSYGGQAMTQANESVICFFGFACDRNEVWYLDETGIQAATGTTFTPTWSGGAPAETMYTAVTLDNVDQVTPIGNTSGNGAETTNPIQVAAALNVTTGDMALVGATSGNAGTYTPDTGYTEGTDQAAASSTTATAYLSIATAGTQQPSATFDAAVNRQTITGTIINHS